MNYASPRVNQIQVNHFLRNQDSGTPAIPLNPDCQATCDSVFNFAGSICNDFEQNQAGMEVYVAYFLPNQDCSEFPPEPCTVKVNGSPMSCTDASDCTTSNCDAQAGALIECSGNIPNLLSCSGVEITVECTSETDSASCD
jgi:hypothetical protein